MTPEQIERVYDDTLRLLSKPPELVLEGQLAAFDVEQDEQDGHEKEAVEAMPEEPAGLFELGPAVPRKGVRGGGGKPEWTEYRPRTPVRCDHCVKVAHATWNAGAGRPYEGLRDAKFKRKHGADILLLCHEHANVVREADRVEFAGVAAVRSSGGRVMS